MSCFKIWALPQLYSATFRRNWNGTLSTSCQSHRQESPGKRNVEKDGTKLRVANYIIRNTYKQENGKEKRLVVTLVN